MIITVTERGTFRRCKQMWDYASFNRQGLTKISTPTALSFGTMIHKTHEAWLLETETPPENHALQIASTMLDEFKSNYKSAVGVEPSDQELEGFYDQTALAREVFQNYKERWGSSLPDGFTLLKPEQTLVLPIPGSEHECQNVIHWTARPPLTSDNPCPECGSPTPGMLFHYLEATLDALMIDEAGRLWVLERKTYNTTPKIESLQLNDQFLGYLWAVQQLDLGPVGGVLYDGIWKRTRVDNRGKERSLDDLFLRVPLIRSPEEIANFGKQLLLEVLDMSDPNLRIYRNRQWNGCWDCQFDPLCTAEFREEDADYVRQRFYMKRTKTTVFEEESA